MAMTPATRAGGFHLDALSSGIPLNVDLDTTLTVIAGNLYWLLARLLPRYQTATPDKLWRHFLDTGGTLHITDNATTCALNRRSYHPRPHRRRLRRPRRPHPLVGRPHPPLPIPLTRRAEAEADLNSITAPGIEANSREPL